MSLGKKALAVILSLMLLAALISVVLKPLFSQYGLDVAKKYSRGRFVCTLDNQGRHTAKLYKLNNGEESLVKTTYGETCIFSRPKVNAGFFVFAIGGGGGATPYESGNAGQVISKHISINEPVIVIKLGKGGKGTFVDENDKFVDAKDGSATIIKDLNLTANGGSKSTRMTPLGTHSVEAAYHIPEKYHLLYDISKSVAWGKGGKFDAHTNNTSAKAQSGHSGAVVIQW